MSELEKNLPPDLLIPRLKAGAKIVKRKKQRAKRPANQNPICFELREEARKRIRSTSRGLTAERMSIDDWQEGVAWWIGNAHQAWLAHLFIEQGRDLPHREAEVKSAEFAAPDLKILARIAQRLRSGELSAQSQKFLDEVGRLPNL